MKQRFFVFFIFTFFFLQPIYADEVVTAGLSPDNALLWRVEIFIEDMNSLLTANQGVKVEKILNHAAERAAELEKMLRWEKNAAAEKAAEKHEKLMNTALEKIQELEHKNAEKEFEAEIHIEASLSVYQQSITEIIIPTDGTMFGEEELIFLSTFSEKNLVLQKQLLDELFQKKDATKLKLKASGLSDADIETLEKNIQKGETETSARDVADAADITAVATAFSTNLSAAASQAATVVDTITDAGVETVEEVVEAVSTIVTDTTTTTKVKIDGDVTAEQMQMINILYEQLRAEKTDAEIEIIVSKMQNDLWKIEKEIDGSLTSLQQQQLDDLILSLSANPSSLKIKIKYDPGDHNGANGVLVGKSDSGITTAFVIG